MAAVLDSAQLRAAPLVPGSGLRIALVAPPWLPVPAPGYGGIELVVSALADGLVRRGHDVTLFAAPGSRSSARVVSPLPDAHPRQMGETLYEIDHTARALEAIEWAGAAGRPFDVVHDHSGFALMALADRVAEPVVHTVHGPFDEATTGFYAHHGHKAWSTALSGLQRSQGPPSMRWLEQIPNPLDVGDWPYVPGHDGYLLWIGRMTPEKGAARAIAVARAAGWPLVLAGPVQPGQEEYFAREVRPHIDGDRVRYLAEVGGAYKQRLFARAAALLMPIRWPEPFGMVMIEALACGTPVLAFPEGAAPEVVAHGRSGYLCDDEAAMVAALARLEEIDPACCRDTVVERYDVDAVTGAYEAAYRRVIAPLAPPAPRGAPRAL
jgi:glycosyltransferase involved in cell wall biosynthesis